MSNLSQGWIYQPVNAPMAPMRLFCFHYGGGSAQIFHKWGAMLAPVAEVCAVQLPGRSSRLREKPFSCMEPLIEELLPIVNKHLDRPYALLGLSLGALIAFELARKLRRQGALLPTALFTVSRLAPQLKREGSTMLGHSDTECLKILEERYGPAPGSELMKDPHMRALVMPGLLADIAIFENYEYSSGDPFSFPVIALRGKADPATTEDENKAWGVHSPTRFISHDFPGGHFFWQEGEGDLVQYVSGRLSECSGGHFRRETSSAAMENSPI